MPQKTMLQVKEKLLVKEKLKAKVKLLEKETVKRKKKDQVKVKKRRRRIIKSDDYNRYQNQGEDYKLNMILLFLNLSLDIWED